MTVAEHTARRTTLHPGDVALGLRGDHLQTLLGSCVAIVLTDPRRTLGVMCHIVHASPARPAQAVNAAYAEVALQQMQSLLMSHGIVASMCEAYVYGGGHMFEGIAPTMSVGDGNAQWALQAMAARGIRVLAADVGGSAYRQLSWTVGPQAPCVVAVQA